MELLLDELKRRRMALINEMPDNSIAILSSANKNFRTRDVENPFRQNSDFLYITGLSEPNLINVIFKNSNNSQTILFRNNTSEKERIWDGSRLDNQDVQKKYGFDNIYNYDNYLDKLVDLLIDKETLVIESGINDQLDSFISNNIANASINNRAGESFPTKIVALHSITQKLRMVKSQFEIDLVKKAAEVSIEGHISAMKKAKPGLYEYELDAEIKYVFNKNNMPNAYMSIVGGGNNACTLHYVKNDSMLKKNDLVLIDSAAECDGYASDITRTFPVDGKFTKEQSEIYDLVLSAQEKAISFIKPGITWDELHNLTVKIISKGLIELGIIQDSFENVIKNEMYKDFYMHKTGHWLGLDVHDVGEYENIKFLPGMVITVEPGIYIDQSNINVEKKWRGIGVRIEDDVLVTNNGSEVLTKKLPKNRNDVEKICKNNG